MKLLSLYIDNFGKLSDYSYDFTKTINSVYQENGWGKTTMTVFIKSMLYGLNKSERSQYTPWKNLSSFGGYLVVEANGREYRIERQFSPSKASGDTFHIFDLASGLEIDSFSPNLGEALLNLNEASFERSVFIPQKDLAEGFGSDIEAKLANLIGGTDDSQSFEDAIDILKTKAKELKLNSKKGLIMDKKVELAQIEEDIAECNTRMEGMPILQKSLEHIDQEISDLTRVKKDINKQIVQYSKSQEKIAKLEVITKYENDIAHTKELLTQNDYVFNGHNVSQEEVLEYRSKNKELLQLRTQYEIMAANTRVTKKIEKIEKEINMTDVPSEETIAKMNEKIMKYNNVKSVINAHKTETKVKKKPTVGIALTIVSSVLLILGIGLFLVGVFTRKDDIMNGITISGIAVAILSILGFLGSLAAFVVTNQQNAALQVGGSVAAYDFEKIHLEEEIREFFGKYHLYSSDFSNNLYIVRSNAQRYREAKDEYKDISLENESLEKKIKDYENSILHFLGQFNSSETCKTNEEKIGELNTHLRKHREIENEILEKERALKNFIESNGLDVLDEAVFDIDALNQKLSEIDVKIDELNVNKTTLSNRMVEFEAEISKYDDLFDAKDEVEQEIRTLEDEYRILNLSLDYLTFSQNSLLEKYVKPMKDSVNKYVTMLLKTSDDYSIDVNFKFQFMTNSGLKSIDSYSRGTQTIIALCMRLALIDCLYPNEKPFVILDDPFVNFDDEKLELAKALMKTISKDYQIVYFTCHNSRIISDQEPIKVIPKPQIKKEAPAVQAPVKAEPAAPKPIEKEEVKKPEEKKEAPVKKEALEEVVDTPVIKAKPVIKINRPVIPDVPDISAPVEKPKKKTGATTLSRSKAGKAALAKEEEEKKKEALKAEEGPVLSKKKPAAPKDGPLLSTINRQPQGTQSSEVKPRPVVKINKKQ